MTDFASLLVADRGQDARPIHLLDKDSFGDWVKRRPAEDRALLEAHRFDGKKGFAFVLLPRGGDFEVVSAVKNADELSPWCLARLGESLPEGTYRLAEGEPGKAALGEPAIELAGPPNLRGGFVGRSYSLKYPDGRTLSLSTYAEPGPNGRWDQFIVSPD